MNTIRRGSYWIQQAANNSPTYPNIVGPHPKYDVAVIGGGITGLSAALKLKEEGKKVIVLEANRVGHGVTGYSTAKLSSLHNLTYKTLMKQFGQQKTRLYAELNEAGIKLVETWVNKYGIECHFERRPNYTYTLQSSYIDSIREEADAAKEAGLDASFSIITDLPFQVKAAVRVENQAQFNSYLYCVGLARAIHSDGCFVSEMSRVVDVSFTSPHVITKEDGENITADHVVMATHIPITDRSGHFAVMEPKRSYCIAYTLHDSTKYPEGMYISAEDNPTFSIRSASDGAGGRILIVGGMGHHVGEDCDTEKNYVDLDFFTRQYFSVKDIICSWSAQDYMPPDEVPYIGQIHRGVTTMYTATGFKKWGLAAGSASAIVFSDMIHERDNSWLSLFNATRWDLRHSAPDMIKVALEEAGHLIGDRVKHMISTVDIESLVPGRGAICKMKGKTVAGYKDENGQLHVLSPVCTHVGCHVNWNQAEKSWDCPCHGSRFGIDGEVLHAPAVKPLKKIEFEE